MTMAFESFSDSSVATEGPVVLEGVWIHDPDDPQGTISSYRFGKDTRSDDREVKKGAIQFIGRTHPIYEFGTYQEDRVPFTVTTPGVNSDEYQSLIDWYELRKTVIFRDNRQRLVEGVLTSFSGSDTSVGNDVALTIEKVGTIEEFI